MNVTVPSTRDNDDFALRVGFLFDWGVSAIGVNRRFKSLAKERKIHLSGVVFFSAVSDSVMNEKLDQKAKKNGQNRPIENCGRSPYHHQIINCVLATPENKVLKAEAGLETPLLSFFSLPFSEKQKAHFYRWVGIWLFADSDDSRSRTESEFFFPIQLRTKSVNQ